MTRARFYLLLLSLVAALLAPAVAFAQGRGGDRDGLLGLLRRDEVRQELGLTDEQVSTLEEYEAKARPGREAFDPLFERLRNAETEEQRNAVRAEMDAFGAKARDEAEAGVRQLLTAEQFRKLANRMIRDRGPSALFEPTVRSELGLSDEQSATLDKLRQQRDEAYRSANFRSGPEKFQALREEWETKPLTVLSESQRAQWDAVFASSAPVAAQEPVRPPASPAAASSEPGRSPAVADDRAEQPAAPSADQAGDDSDEVVVSFGTTRSDEDAPPAAEPRTLSFNFRFAPWSEVLQLFADYANLTLDLGTVPPGTFNYYDDRKYTPTEALDVLNGYLLQKGYILVRRDNFLVCLNVDDGIPPNLVPNITADELPKRGQNELLNVVFPIEGVSATDAAREVELLLGPQGKVVPLGTSNSLVVTDIGSNLRRIDRLLTAVSAAGPGDLVFKPYALAHLDPRDAEATVKEQLGISAGVRSVSSAYEDWRRDRDRDDDRDSRSSRSSTPAAAPATTAKVTADDRTGSLLVTATAAQHRIVEEVLKATDVPVEGQGGRRVQSNEPFLKVYTLHDSDAEEVVKTLDVLMPGVVVNEDGRNDKIHIHAPQAVHDEVETLIRQLDGEGSGNGSAVTVISLSTLDPYAAATTIRSLFAGDEEDAPIIEADSFGRRLLVRGSADQVAQVKTLLAQLGEDGSGRPGAGYSTGPVRTIPLGGRDPEEMIPLLQRIWETSGDTPLRFVPSSPGTIIERRPLGRTAPPLLELPTASDDRERDGAPAANFNVLDPVPVSEAVPVGEAVADDAEPPAEAVEQPAETEDEVPAAEEEPVDASEGEVALTVQGGNLVLASEDEESLDRLEDLIQRLGQVIPPRTKWTVFYLRTADATETAMLLEQLFPSSSVSTASLDSGLFGSLTSGLSSFGGSIMDAAGLDSLGLDSQTLRIIPDLRSNSLFVTGPPDKVAEVEQVLNVLDATDLPDSLRARVPRMIEVKHADVDEVATIVREVYKDYLQPANMAAMAGNPLAMLLGGGGGGGGGRDRERRDEPPGQIRLTIGVDSSTSRLIVSADDALFKQIEELVATLDQAQLDAKRTVRVVTLQNADVASIQNTIGSLIPKVRTSSTAERRNGTNGQPSGSNNGGSSERSGGESRGDGSGGGGQSSEDQERIRNFFEERMRERMREQLGGGGDRGGNDRGGDRGGSRSLFGGGDRGDSGRRGR